MAASTEFKVHSPAVMVTCEGSTHYQIGLRMIASGLLEENGFHQVADIPDTVVLLPKPGVDPTDVTMRLAEEIERRKTASS